MRTARSISAGLCLAIMSLALTLAALPSAGPTGDHAEAGGSSHAAVQAALDQAAPSLHPHFVIQGTDPAGAFGGMEFGDNSSVAIAAGGEVYVTDPRNHRIQKLTRRGAVLGVWGGRGTAEGQLMSPLGLDVAPDGTVYLATSESLYTFGPTGEARGHTPLANPCGGRHSALSNDYVSIDARPDGSVLVAWSTLQCVDILGREATTPWRVELYPNPWLAERPVVVESVGTLDFERGAGSPDGRWVPPEGFSARFERHLGLDTPARLSLDIQATGGLRLWADDRLVADEWNAEHVSRVVETVLDAGDHRIVVEYHDTSAAAAVKITDWLAPAAGPPMATTTLEPEPTRTIEVLPTATTGVMPTAGATDAGPQWVVYLPALVEQQ